MSGNGIKSWISKWGVAAIAGIVIIAIVAVAVWKMTSLPNEQTAPSPTATAGTGFSGDPVEAGAERDSYIEMAKEAVTKQLTCPETAVYPEGAELWSVRMGKTVMEVSSTVEAENTAGEKVVSSFIVQFLSGAVSYMKIDEAESGERVTE